MLSLTRKSNESITFNVRGVEFTVMVGKIKGNSVHILVDGDKNDIIVARTEIYDRNRAKIETAHGAA